MKIKLSKSQWRMIGQKTGWMKKANVKNIMDQVQEMANIQKTFTNKKPFLVIRLENDDISQGEYTVWLITKNKGNINLDVKREIWGETLSNKSEVDNLIMEAKKIGIKTTLDYEAQQKYNKET